MKTNGITQEFIGRLSNTSIDQPQTAFVREISEATLIRNFQGNLLNSKLEYNNCMIPELSNYVTHDRQTNNKFKLDQRQNRHRVERRADETGNKRPKTDSDSH